ncbi:MAG: helix-turn-helix transcriptional regulator [Polyangiaceae bacterium]
MFDPARHPSPARGVLRSAMPNGVLEGRRLLPGPLLAGHVHHLWSVRWALASPYLVDVLPHPVAQIRYEERAGRCKAELWGVHSGRVVKRLRGDGRLFGVSFQPAMFQPLYGKPMASLTDRVVPLADVFGARADEWARALQAAHPLEEELRVTEEFLAPLLGPISDELALLRQLIEQMATRRELLSVGDCCRLSGLSLRALQRSFRDHVGVSPKWVLRRYRLHDAALELAKPNPPQLAALAAELGYADQAHFQRDFKRATGRTPRSFTQGFKGLRPAQ